MASTFPLFQATSIECLMARSTLEEVVLYFLAAIGYNTFVIPPRISILWKTRLIDSLKYIYPFIWAGTPISCKIEVISVSKFSLLSFCRL